jgi:hypothetical protein
VNPKQPLLEYYRTPFDSEQLWATPELSGDPGFFRWMDSSFYGQCESGVASDVAGASSCDASKYTQTQNSKLHLPFNASQVIDNLRSERYENRIASGSERNPAQGWLFTLYYSARALLPVSLRRALQRAYFSDWRKIPFPVWPVDFTVDNLHEHLLRMSMEASGVKKIPFIWFWPEGAPSCLIMTHDVETTAGRDFTSKLMDLDESYGIVAAFEVVPEKRYGVPDEYVQEIKRRGFEFNVHDLNHDGLLYHERKEFERRAKAINGYVRKYGAHGFRAGSMHRNLDWYQSFDFSYDMSVPNVAHFEPKRGGCCTVMPYFVGKILELPLTAAQDYCLFHMLNDYSINLWKSQIEMIYKKHGLISFICHPDYLIEARPRAVYDSLLAHLREFVSREKVWHALPKDVDRWWRARSQMNLVRNGNEWEIEGPEKDRARIAYAILEDGRLRYEVAGAAVPESVNL